MLSSFFSKSKPINYIVVALYMIVLFCIAHYKQGFDPNGIHIALAIGSIVIYILPTWMLSTELQRNDLTQKGTFTILLYAAITGLLPDALVNLEILLSNVFIQFAAQNLIYLKNERHVKLRILNASICVGFASLAYFYSIGFIGLVFFGILYFDPKNYKNWIIPLIGLIAVYILANCFTLLVDDTFFGLSQRLEPTLFTFSAHFIRDHLFSITILSIFVLFFFTIFLIKFGKKTASTKPIFKVVIAYFVFALLVAIITPNKNTKELFFMATPLAIIGTTYLEMSYNRFAKEINIWALLLLPFALLFL